MTDNAPITKYHRRILQTADAVTLSHNDCRLEDVSSINDTALSAEERIQAAQWRRARSRELRIHLRAQCFCWWFAIVAMTLAGLSAISSQTWGGREQFTTLTLFVVGFLAGGVALVIEVAMAGHAGYQPWPLRFRLDREGRDAVNLRSLRDSVEQELLGGSRSYEARVVIVAADIAAAITSRDGWRSDYLDDHYLRCDIDNALVRIAGAAVNAYRVRRDVERNSIDLTPPTATPTPTPPCGAEWEAALNYLAWLLHYQLQLHALESTLAGGMAPPTQGGNRLTASIETDLRFTILVLDIVTP
jgi:hypothetical protein